MKIKEPLLMPASGKLKLNSVLHNGPQLETRLYDSSSMEQLTKKITALYNKSLVESVSLADFGQRLIEILPNPIKNVELQAFVNETLDKYKKVKDSKSAMGKTQVSLDSEARKSDEVKADTFLERLTEMSSRVHNF